MRIGIDGSCWANRRGFGRFTRCLVDEMVRRDDANEYVIVTDERTVAEGLMAPPPGAEVVGVALGVALGDAAAAGSRSVRDLLRMTAAVRRLRCDTFLFPASYSYFPVFGPPVVVVVHDAIAESLPSLTLPSFGDRARWRVKQYLALRQAKTVVTVSVASKLAIASTFKIPAERLVVIREAPDAIFRADADPGDKEALGRYGLAPGSPYLLYVGGISPHKNLLVLVQAFEEVAAGQPDVRLLLVGDTDDDPFLSSTDSIRAAASRSPVADRITLTGFVPDADLAALYRGAVASVQPSLAEGFGLTAAESAACGTPVVASRDPALMELLGDAGLYADAHRPAEFAHHLTALVTCPEHRADQAEAVTKAAAEWSWAAAADTTISVLANARRRR